MSTIAPYAREIFADAYALHGPVPLPESARALCDAAVALAEENATDPRCLSMVAEIAKYEGLQATLYERRQKLSTRWQRKIKPVTKAIAAGFDAPTFVSHAVAAAGDTHRPDDNSMGGTTNPKPDVITHQRAVKVVAAVALAAFLKDHPTIKDDYTELVSLAEAEAAAEGIVAGTALAEPQQVTLDLDKLYDETLKNLRQLDTYGEAAPEWIRQQLDGLAGDMGKAIADAIARNFGSADMAAAVNDIIDKGAGVQAYIDEAIHFSSQQAAISQMIALGVSTLDFVTQPDACDECAPLDSSVVGPYTQQSVPNPPLHINCRCTVEPAGNVS